MPSIFPLALEIEAGILRPLICSYLGSGWGFGAVFGGGGRWRAWPGVDAREGWGYDAVGADGVGELRKGWRRGGLRSSRAARSPEENQPIFS